MTSRAVNFGVAELVPDPRRTGAWTLLVDGVSQSYVDLMEPTHLEFEYLRRLASVLDTMAPAGRPLRVLHLGGGAFTLPRYVAATRSGSVQVVVERDGALAALVQDELPLPTEAGIEVRIGDARAVVDAAVADPGRDRYDLIITDVYQAAQMPGSVATAEFAAGIASLLNPGGVYGVNVADLPPLAFSKVQAATLRTVFAEVCVLAEPGLLRGRRYGNSVLVAAADKGRLPVARLARAAARDPFPARLIAGADVVGFCTGAAPLTDAGLAAGVESLRAPGRPQLISVTDGPATAAPPGV